MTHLLIGEFVNRIIPEFEVAYWEYQLGYADRTHALDCAAIMLASVEAVSPTDRHRATKAIARVQQLVAQLLEIKEKRLVP